MSQANPLFPSKMFIDGTFVTGEGEPLRVENPASGTIFHELSSASTAQIEQAIAAAQRVADSGEWSERSAAERRTAVLRLIDLLSGQRERLRKLVVLEAGCPVSSPVMLAQVDFPIANCRQIVDLYEKLPEVEENPLPLDARFGAMGGVAQSVRRYVPHGVVSAISAYNFPFFLNLWKIVPALLTGNSVILRPSPLTPLCALAIADAAVEAGLPAGVLNIIAEAGHEGARLLTTHDHVDMVSFTGSTDVGRAVMAQGAPTLKRLQLELGGKSARIYLPDAVEDAKSAAMAVVCAHAGQGCVLGTRVLVPEADKAAVLEAMRMSVAGLKIGDPADPATQFGPVISAGQIDRCERYVRLAMAAGARVVAGGRRIDRPGHYFEPTVLDVPDNANPAARDEIFGPIVSVIGYRDIDHAVAMANDTIFGLSGYVHGRDSRAALAVARRIRSGTVNVNLPGMMSGYVSSGGHKHSGLGRERGVEGLRIYQDIQCLNFAG